MRDRESTKALLGALADEGTKRSPGGPRPSGKMHQPTFPRQSESRSPSPRYGTPTVGCLSTLLHPTGKTGLSGIRRPGLRKWDATTRLFLRFASTVRVPVG